MTQVTYFYADNERNFYDMEKDALNKQYENGVLDDISTPDDNNIPDQTPEVQNGD